jgi:hypothetical protein
MKKVFLTAVAVLALGSLDLNAKTVNFDFGDCSDVAFDAVAAYYASGGTDGFTAGFIYEATFSSCQENMQ